MFSFFSFISLTLLTLFCSFVADALPNPSLNASQLAQNGRDAQTLNAQFATIKSSDPCNDNELSMACVDTAFAQCIDSKWALTPCSAGTTCVVLPLVNKLGTSITCDTLSDALARIGATGVQGGLTSSGSNSSATLAAQNATSTNGVLGDNDNGECTDGNNDGRDVVNSTSTDAGNEPAAATVTITVTASAPASTSPSVASSNSTTDSASSSNSTSNSASVSPTIPQITVSASRTAALAPSVTLTPVSAASTSTSTSTSASTPPSAQSPAPTLISFNTTMTLSPASASALISSLEANNPNGVTVITVGAPQPSSTASPNANITSVASASAPASFLTPANPSASSRVRRMLAPRF